MYQNNYTNIPEQYINIIKNGPDENTVIRGRLFFGDDLEIWVKPKIIIGITTKKPEKIYLVENGQFVVSHTKITENFGAKWVPMFQKLFPGWLK